MQERIFIVKVSGISKILSFLAKFFEKIKIDKFFGGPPKRQFLNFSQQAAKQLAMNTPVIQFLGLVPVLDER